MSLVRGSLQRWRRHKYASRCSNETMHQFLSVDWQPPSTLFTDASLLVVDLETTALNVHSGEIASIGWVPIGQGAVRLADSEHHLVRVHKGVGQSAVYHQIHDDDLSMAEPLIDVMERFITVAVGKVLVFHHAELDMKFLNKAAKSLYGSPLLAPVVDTMRIEKKRLQRSVPVIEAGALRLFACRHRYGLPPYPAHDALVDALATAELLLAQLSDQPGCRLSSLY